MHIWIFSWWFEFLGRGATFLLLHSQCSMDRKAAAAAAGYHWVLFVVRLPNRIFSTRGVRHSSLCLCLFCFTVGLQQHLGTPNSGASLTSLGANISVKQRWEAQLLRHFHPIPWISRALFLSSSITQSLSKARELWATTQHMWDMQKCQSKLFTSSFNAWCLKLLSKLFGKYKSLFCSQQREGFCLSYIFLQPKLLYPDMATLGSNTHSLPGSPLLGRKVGPMRMGSRGKRSLKVPVVPFKSSKQQPLLTRALCPSP